MALPGRRVSRGREIDVPKLRILRRDVLEAMRRERAAQARVYERDARNLTWAGRRLVKPFYLDEVPQLRNVLRGEMSVVGPRPWRPRWSPSRSPAARPTGSSCSPARPGLAQLAKGEVRFEEAEALDLAYAEAWRTHSSWRLRRLDASILVATVTMMLRGRGAGDYLCR